MNLKNRKKASQKITLIGAIVDFFLASFKVIAGTLGNSGALIADGIHSFSDLISDSIILCTTKYSTEKADEQHPYGHERFETVATLGLSIILSIVAFGIVIDSIDRFNNPSVLSYNTLLFSVVGLSIFSKEALYWYTLRVAKTYNSNMLKANAWHHRSDSMSSIVVLVGIFGSLNGYLYLDGVAAIVVGLMVFYIAWELGIDAVKELVDTSIDAVKVKRLQDAIGMINGVNSVHSLRTRKTGSVISADVHVQVDPFLSVSEGHMISVSVERVAKKCLEDLTDVTVHIDVENDEILMPCEHLPERDQALDILNKALLKNKCGKEIQRIQLHYICSKIHVDFYLPLSCISSDNSRDDILNRLTGTVKELYVFGNVQIFFS